jgi:uncharacterized protein YndB with AHSA1/START domain
MAKNKASKAVKKTASNPKAKAVSASKSTKKATAQVVKKDVKPAKKENNKVIAKKSAKAVPANTAIKNTKPQPKKGAAPEKGKTANVEKEKALPKAQTANGAKPAAPAAKPAAPAKGQPPAPAAKPVKGKIKEKPVLTPEQMALPKLPSNITYKRSKQKLAPGEKRLVKTEVITHHVIHDKPIEPEKVKKAEPKGKYEMEYIIRCPVTLLYDFLTTPSGLQEWFADDVHLKDDVYTFNWDGQQQKATLLNAKIDSYLRFRWVDKPEGTYVEFRITQDELTNEVSLTVTDFGDNEEDIATNKRLWDTQIQRLVKIMGAY